MRAIGLLCVIPLTVSCASAPPPRAAPAPARGDAAPAPTPDADQEPEALADQLDAQVRKAPHDAALRARRDDARQRAVAQIEEQIRRADRDLELDTVVQETLHLLSVRRRWSLSLDVTEAVARVQSIVTIQVKLLRPLVAEASLVTRRIELGAPELDALWPELDAWVRAYGAKECGDVRTRSKVASSPYLARLASAYCAHFGVEVPAPRLPGTIAGVKVKVAVDGLRPEQQARLQAAVGESFAKSAWYGAGGALPVAASVRGSVDVKLTAEDVIMEQPWEEQVPYTVTEAYDEPYVETYKATAVTPGAIPVRVPRTEFYTCGPADAPRTCAREVMVTYYRTEKGTTQVARRRLRTRKAQRTVTRYQPQPRVFSYPAVHREGVYRGDWTLTVPLAPGAEPVVATVEAEQRRDGLDHDAEHAGADVHPSRAKLPSADEWFADLLSRFDAEVRKALAARWAAAFCHEKAFTPETAARCRLGAELPSHARPELETVYGDEVEYLDRVLPR